MRINVLKKIKKCFLVFKVKSLQFKKSIYHLVNFKWLNKDNVVKDIIYFKVKIQRSSFVYLILNKICENMYDFFSIKDCTISIAYSYCKPLSTKIFNYRQTAFSDINIISLVCPCNNI